MYLKNKKKQNLTGAKISWWQKSNISPEKKGLALHVKETIRMKCKALYVIKSKRIWKCGLLILNIAG